MNGIPMDLQLAFRLELTYNLVLTVKRFLLFSNISQWFHKRVTQIQWQNKEIWLENRGTEFLSDICIINPAKNQSALAHWKLEMSNNKQEHWEAQHYC